MKELTVLSGKGGTGKTSVTAAFATIAANVVLCDNDVDASNLHLLEQPLIKEEHIFRGGWKAVIDESICKCCGLCQKYCQFSAIHQSYDGMLVVEPYQCEGCRLCERLCPEKAIFSHQSDNNRWFVSECRYGKMVHARMGPGEENSGKLVNRIRKRARELASESGAQWILNDGPPGVGCATISSLSGVDGVILVAEPSVSGLHDAQRLYELTRKFELPVIAIINKYDLHQDSSGKLRDFLLHEAIPVAAQLPFDERMVKAMVAGKSVIEYAPEAAISRHLLSAWKVIEAGMGVR